MYAKSLLSAAATALQLGKSWPEESPFREEFALLRASDGLHLAGTMVRRAMRAGDGKRLVVASEEQRPQCVDQGDHHELRQGDDQRKSICAADSAEEHGLLEADHRAS